MKWTKEHIVFLFKYVCFKFRRQYKIFKLERIKSYEGTVSEDISNLLEVVADDMDYDCFHVRVLGQNYNLKEVNWSEDVLSSHVYAKERFDKLRYERLFNQGIEVKNPWELSRFQFFIYFVLQYRKSRDIAYYEEFKSIVYHWHSENTYLYGINWTCTMEVAIRAINWIFACSLFGRVFWEDVTFKEFLRDRLIEHGRYIYSFPEKSLGGSSNNHLATDYCGLFVISAFIQNKESEKWKRTAVRGLEECMDKQVLDDGCDFECSIPYHRLITEIFIVPAFLDYNRKQLSSAYYSKLFKMLEFVESYTDVVGNAPQMGDNDSGVILPFNRLDNQNHLYVLQLGEYVFDFDFLKNKRVVSPLLYLYPKRQEKISLEKLGCTPRRFENPAVFAQGGYCVLKNEIFDLVVYAPSLKRGGHRHHDTGNFALSYKGIPIVEDPGTGCYTSDFLTRNRLKASSSHNIYYRDCDQSFSKQIFLSEINHYSTIEKASDDRIVVKISYLSQEVYFREFRMEGNKIIITDRFLVGSDEFTGGLNFNERVRVENDVFCSSGVSVKLEGVKDWRVKEYDYSPEYGRIESKQRVEYTPSRNVKIIIYAQDV